MTAKLNRALKGLIKRFLRAHNFPGKFIEHSDTEVDLLGHICFENFPFIEVIYFQKGIYFGISPDVYKLGHIIGTAITVNVMDMDDLPTEDIFDLRIPIKTMIHELRQLNK